MTMLQLYLLVPLAPLIASIVVGLWGGKMPRAASHWITCVAVAIAMAASFVIWRDVAAGHTFNADIYTWVAVGDLKMTIRFLIDPLTAMMMLVVTFVSLMVHVYTIGYMADDPGYSRFFSYICLFTFSMLMLVMSNNFLQLFFGWEAVGLVSYLLIGFWFTRPTAIYANLKAFLANRVGDFGFILGVGLVLSYFGTLDYAAVFAKAPELAGTTLNLWGTSQWSMLTVACICLFVGAMGKSAQVPLHVWLPDSMEGPTPISALIHAATMVTAGIFLVARMSPLFEFSDTALAFVTVIGATGALFMGFLGMVQFDIKRVVAYSTLSQLGYMTVALGVSAYAGGVYHLMTHAFFKALLFLGAGSVIIAMHHEQDMRYMGGLKKYMPITWITMWIGSLALAGAPGFAGFFSKDAIIEAVGESHRFGSGYAYFCVMTGVFVTALYSFRLLYMTFHGKERFVVETHHHAHGHDEHDHGEHKPGHLAHAPHESPWVVTLPLILLAIPSVLIGWFTVGPMLFGKWFGNAIRVNEANDVLGEIGREFQGPMTMVLHGFMQWPFWIAFAGFAVATYIWLLNPGIADKAKQKLHPIFEVLNHKYWFDEIYQAVFARGGVALGRGLWKGGDVAVIDGLAIDGSTALVQRFSSTVRWLQSGYLYHYAFAMILGLIALLGGVWWVVTHAGA